MVSKRTSVGLLSQSSFPLPAARGGPSRFCAAGLNLNWSRKEAALAESRGCRGHAPKSRRGLEETEGWRYLERRTFGGVWEVCGEVEVDLDGEVLMDGNGVGDGDIALDGDIEWDGDIALDCDIALDGDIEWDGDILFIGDIVEEDSLFDGERA